MLNSYVSNRVKKNTLRVINVIVILVIISSLCIKQKGTIDSIIGRRIMSYQNEKLSQPNNRKTIINVPIDSRPISRLNFEELVEASGYNYIEISNGLDNMVKNTDTQGVYAKGNYEETVKALKEAFVYGDCNDEDSIVILNLSSYFFDGLIATRDWTSYEQMEEKISELEYILENFKKPNYYVIMALPRVKPDFRVIDYPSGVNEYTHIRSPIDFAVGSNIEVEESSINFSEAVMIWQYTRYIQRSGGAEFSKLPQDLKNWCSAFYSKYQNFLENYDSMFTKAYEYIDELNELHKQYDFEYILAVDDYEMPKLKNIPTNDYMRALMYDAEGRAIKYSGSEYILNQIEKRNNDLNVNNNVNIQFLHGLDEINHLILARELVKDKNVRMNFEYLEPVTNEKLQDVTQIWNYRGGYDAITIGDILTEREKFINEKCEGEDEESIDLYISNQNAYPLNEELAQKAKENIYNSLENTGGTTTVGIVATVGGKLYFNKLCDGYEEKGIFSIPSFTSWGTWGNSIGVSMSITTVHSILQSEIREKGLSYEMKNRLNSYNKVKVRSVLEDLVYNNMIKTDVDYNEKAIRELLVNRRFNGHDLNEAILYSNANPEVGINLIDELESNTMKIANIPYTMSETAIRATNPWYRQYEVKIEVSTDVEILDNQVDGVRIKYSSEEPTNKNVTVTITSNEMLQGVEGWQLSEDKMKLTKIYSANTSETVKIKDLAGNEVEVKVAITNIDKTIAIPKVSYSTEQKTKENVTVIITANEELQVVEGWTISEDKMKLTKTYSANTSETVKIKDLAGNEVEVKVAITNIDKTIAIPKVSYSTEQKTKENITVTITANEELQEVEGWTISEDKMKLIKTYSANTSETVKVKDLAGNEVEVKVAITNIDKTIAIPKVSYSTEQKTKENVTVTITANEELQEVEGWTISEDKMKLIKTYSANTSETVKVKDLAGNEVEVKVAITNIDKTIAIPKVSYSTEQKTKENITVTITSNEELQVVEGWQLSEDKMKLTKTYSANTSETIKVKDLAGNEVDVKVAITNIDKTIAIPKVSYSTEQKTKENVTVTITANEMLQGLEGWQLSEDKMKLTKTYSVNTSETIKVKDLAGNEVDVKVAITNIDKTIAIPKVSYSTEQKTKENVTVTITANEELQEVEGWTISEDKMKLIKTYSANISETIKVKDLAGNEVDVKVAITNIDKTIAIPKVSYSTEQKTKENVTVTITANEELQGVEGWTISEDKMKLIKTYSANTSETIKVKDLAGNEVDVKVAITNIDKTIAIPKVSYSTEQKTKENVTVTITANEELQEVEGWTISEDKMKLTKTYEQNTTEEVTIKDIVGNEANVLIDIQNIDKELLQPEIEYSSTEPTKENVTVTIIANEELQVVEGWTISEDKMKLTKTYEQNTTEEVTIKDIAGNEANVLIDIQNIDKELLQPEIEYSSTEPTKENVTVTIIANEEIQEVEGWTISEDKMKLIKTYSANTSETIKVKDLAGNEVDVKVAITNIDKTIAIPKVSYSTEQKTKENVTVTITANEELQGVEGWQLSEDKKELIKTYEENTTEEVTIKDLAGNEAVVEIKINNIEDYFYIEGYEIQDGYVLEIPEQIKIEDFISKIKTNQEYTIYEMRKEEGETENKEVEAEGIIKTGQVIKVNGKVICTLIVKGDVTGDGIVDINDAINTLRHAVEQEGKELKGAYLKAADMNEDNFVDVTDAIQTLKYSVSK